MQIEKSNRLKQLPPYLFAEIDRKKKQLIAEGKDVLNLGVGDPDSPTPPFIVEEMKKNLHLQDVQKYPFDNGSPNFRAAIARWHKRNTGVTLDPNTEIYPLIGSKEGIAHVPLALVNPGDYTLVPEPGYPPYRSGTVFAGGIPYFMPLKMENGFLPDFSKIPSEVAKKTKLMYLNYPNNPTGALADESFYRIAVDFCAEHNIVLCQDAAYSEMYFGNRPISVLQVGGGRDVAVEFHSLSKTFSMCGWRMGWIAGNSAVVKLMGELKTNLDSGQFMAIQETCAYALDNGDEEVKKLRAMYERRRNLFINALNKLNLDIQPQPATFYVWFRVPQGFTSVTFANALLEKANVVVTPGNGFGPSGEGFIRISLTSDEKILLKAAERITNCRL